ncbi:hypothetical protein ABE322_21495 [Priestia megaterium]
MEDNKKVELNTPEGLELNPFIHFSKNKPKQAILIRWLVFSVVLTILTVIVAKNVPYSFDELNTNGQEGMPNINEMLNDNPSAQSFLIAMQGISAFFTPIIFIVFTTIGLKILTSIFKPIFKEKITMQHLFLATTVAYTAFFISSALRLVFSIFQKKFLMHSLGSLPHYTGSPSSPSFVMNFLNSLDLFSIIFCALLSLGLYSYSKAKLKPVLILIFSIYFIFTLGQALIFPSL